VRAFWWRARYRLAQWLCPHKCREPIKVPCVFEGGPANGKVHMEQWLDYKLVVPEIGAAPIRPFDGHLRMEEPPITLHRYALRNAVYVYVEPKP
jgi:hypothetical protein